MAGLCLVILCGELIIRAGVGLNLWPEPRLGSINAELDIKLQSLDARQKTDPVDCLFLGSSQMDAAINPDTFSDEYRKLTGQSLRCFNFSLGTLTAGPAATVAHILVSRYHPKLLVVGISARDFSRDFGELSRSFKDDPWVRYSLGEPNIPGWLTANSLFFRLSNQFRAFFNPDYTDFRRGLLISLRPNGYLYREGNELHTTNPPTIPQYSLYKEDLNGLDEILVMQNAAMQVIVLEIPVYPKFMDTYVKGKADNYYSLFRQPILERIAKAQIPFVLSQELANVSIPDEDWNDVLHLNYRGTEIFCRWFAGQVNQILARSGQ